MLSHSQTEDENRREFIARLIAAGWSEAEALEEWENIQNDTEGNLD